MPITDSDIDAMKSRIIELETIVGDLGKELKKFPDSSKLGSAYEAAKDEITRLNLRIDKLEKPAAPVPEGGDPDVRSEKIDPWDW